MTLLDMTPAQIRALTHWQIKCHNEWRGYVWRHPETDNVHGLERARLRQIVRHEPWLYGRPLPGPRELLALDELSMIRNLSIFR